MITNLLSRILNARLWTTLYRGLVRFIDAMPKHTSSRRRFTAHRVSALDDYHDNARTRRRPRESLLQEDAPPDWLHEPTDHQSDPPTAETATAQGPARTFYRQFLLPPPPPNTRVITVFVRGARNAGKTTFITTICESDVQRIPERRLPRGGLTIEDFGRIQVYDGLVLDLIGTTSMEHDLQIPAHIRCDSYSGTIFLVDGTSTRNFHGMHPWWERARQHTPPPYITALTKIDAERSVPPDQLRRFANVPLDEMLLPCIATRRTSVHRVVSNLLDDILRWLDA